MKEIACLGYDEEVEKRKDDNNFVNLRPQESKTPRKNLNSIGSSVPP